MKKVILVLLFALLGGTLLTACGGDSVDTAKADYCSSVASLGKAIATWKGLTVNSTVEEVNNAKKGLEDAWQQTVDSSKDLKESQIDALQSAYDETKKNITDVSSQDTIAQVITNTAVSIETLDKQTQAIMTTFCVGVVTVTK